MWEKEYRNKILVLIYLMLGHRSSLFLYLPRLTWHLAGELLSPHKLKHDPTAAAAAVLVLL